MRIGINVPNELIQRVRQANPHINLSQFCRAALEGYAAKSERAWEFAFNNYEEMEKIAKMLVEMDEHPPVAPDWTGYGLNDARDWVRTVSTAEWERFFEVYDFLYKRDGEEANSYAGFARGPDGVKGFYDRWEEHKELFNWLMDQDIDVPFLEYQKTYHDAWMFYVLEVRRMSLEHRRAKRERITGERREAWKAITPEVPPQLR